MREPQAKLRVEELRVERPRAVDPDFASGARLGTAAELGAALGLSVSGVWKLRASGRVPAVKLQHAVRFHLPTVWRKLGVGE